jgi:hypothetical protein
MKKELIYLVDDEKKIRDLICPVMMIGMMIMMMKVHKGEEKGHNCCSGSKRQEQAEEIEGKVIEERVEE